MSSHPFQGLLRKLLPIALLIPVMATAAPQVAVSIPPLQLLAAAITDGVSTPAVVWGQGQDPHHVSLRPSERRVLGEADLVLWVGPMLEQPLADLVGELDAKVLTVQDVPQLALIEVDGQPDPHAWVDTRNARRIAASLADMLVELDPPNAQRYRDNLAAFDAALGALATELGGNLAAATQRNWSVYHHALRYFEQEFGLRAPIMLADSENNAPGLRTAVRVLAQLREQNITCMLAEPGVNHDEVATMLDIPELRIVDADVMGRGAAAPDYVTYMRSLATTFSDCLEAAP